jgi:DNA-binding protein
MLMNKVSALLMYLQKESTVDVLAEGREIKDAFGHVVVVQGQRVKSKIMYKDKQIDQRVKYVCPQFRP